jgi:hypothetical protein
MSMSAISLRAVLAVACAGVAVSACGYHTYGSASAAPDKPLDAAALIVSLDEMRHLTGVPGLGQMSELKAGPHKGGYGQIPASCRALSNMDVAFGQTWKQFKGFNFTDVSSGTGSGVLQAVGVYADSDAARDVFGHLLSDVQECAALHVEPFHFSVSQQDSSNFALSREQGHTLYRVKDAVVIEVEAYHFPDSANVAQTVLQTISDRIPDA